MTRDPNERTHDQTSERRIPLEQRRTHLFLVLTADTPRRLGARFDVEAIDKVTFGRAPSTTHGRRGRELAIGLDAPALSREHAVLERRGDGWLLSDCGSRNGTFVNGRRVESAEVSDGDLLEMGRAIFVLRTALPTPVETPPDLDERALAAEARGFRTLLPSYAAKLRTARRIATSTVTVLLRGETGTGKEVVARAIHEASGRRGPFVAVNCGALPPGLVEASLFGHRRGAFSGALRDEPGYVRAAHGGTLLLDEIGELPAASQVALLRVLQEKEVVPVGESRPVPVDLRVIAATHRSLDEAVTGGAFRADLLARLRGFELELPPLRARREDLGLLLADALGDRDVRIASTVARALLRHDWPFNARELVQAITAGCVLASADGRLEPEAFTTGPLARLVHDHETTPAAPAKADDLDELEVRLKRLLEQHQGNVAAVARDSGKAPFQIHRWMKKLGLDPNDFRKR